MSCLHTQLSGGHSFAAFVQHQQAQRTAMGQVGAPLLPTADYEQLKLLSAQVLDQSPSGYRMRWPAEAQERVRVGDRKSGVSGKRVSVGVEPGGRGINKQKKKK